MVRAFLKALMVSMLFLVGLAANDKGCMTCYEGIEDIRHSKSKMTKQIEALGKPLGDSAGCTICHGGNVKETKDANLAHKGAPNHPGGLEAFVRDPGSMWINDKTCGMCHSDTVNNLHKSLMQAEAGKIQGNMHSWGNANKKEKYGNYNIEDKDGTVPSWGTDTYKKYMTSMISKYPDQFPTKLKQLPLPPQNLEKLALKDKKKLALQANITYQRSDCQRCHVGV